MSCKLCQQRTKGRARKIALDTTCAFEEGHIFARGNWGCELMIQLRNKAMNEGHCVWCEDQWIATIPIEGEGEFVVITWYKARGQTDNAFRIATDGDIEPLTLEVAEELCLAS